VCPVVNHSRPSRYGLEAVLVTEPRERAGDLFVDKLIRRIEARDPAGQCPPAAEMTGAPRDCLVSSDSSARPTANGTLVGARHRPLVEVDVTSEVEDALDRSTDHGFQVNVHHGRPPE
jgi:hypothetical protein